MSSSILVKVSTAFLFTSHSRCGDKAIRAPFAPPRLSPPRKVDAEAQPRETSSPADSPNATIFAFASSILAVDGIALAAGNGSCQIKSSAGTSGPN